MWNFNFKKSTHPNVHHQSHENNKYNSFFELNNRICPQGTFSSFVVSPNEVISRRHRPVGEEEQYRISENMQTIFVREQTFKANICKWSKNLKAKINYSQPLVLFILKGVLIFAYIWCLDVYVEWRYVTVMGFQSKIELFWLYSPQIQGRTAFEHYYRNSFWDTFFLSTIYLKTHCLIIKMFDSQVLNKSRNTTQLHYGIIVFVYWLALSLV